MTADEYVSRCPACCRRCGDELGRDAFGLCGRCLDNS